jgi:DNA-binding CsgD family transcriptional regulator
LLTVQGDLSLAIAAFGHANRDNQRIRQSCCAAALNGYRGIWRTLSRERRIVTQPSELLAKLGQLRTALINLLGDEGWPTDQVPKIAPTVPARTTRPPKDPKHQQEQSFEDLTSRESEVLKCIAQGNSTKEIAALLGVAFKTAACHRYRLMDKLGIHDTASLVRYAIRNDIIQA